MNPRQKEAAEFGDGQLLILAGAGSGKTRVIVHRIAYLIGARGVDPYHILAVTFTNKAAEEMQARVQRMLGPAAGRLWVSTFHSLGAQILRQRIDRLGYSREFVIYDDADQLSLLKKILREKGLDPKMVNPKLIRALIDQVKRLALTEQELKDSPDPRFQTHLPVLLAYQKRLREANAVDFGDLLLLTYRLFDRFPDVLAHYRERFQYVMVDEYQDTNRVQYLMVRQIAGESGNICVVGDEDQSIYRWRGADISNILNFERDYPRARAVLLEQNYRSTQTIIEAASEVIGRNFERKAKRLWTENAAGEKIRLYRAGDERDEAQWVVEEALRQKGLGRSLDDVAVFYRTHAQSRVFEDELRSRNVSYAVYGGTRFYDRKEVKDMIAYLKFLENAADEVSLMRIINLPGRGIGDKTLEAVEEEKRQAGGDWLAAIKGCVAAGSVGAKARAGLEQFARLIEEFKPLLDGPVTPLASAVIDRSGYRKMLEDEGTVEAASRIENLDELINAVRDYEKSDPAPSLRGFLEKVTLATDLDAYDPAAGRLTLMTLHSAKGLEFPAVFLVGMEDGLFPHIRSLVIEEEDEDSSALEEERRLCYVGMTRAKELLYLTLAGERALRGYRQKSDPSMFIAEIPGRYIHEVRKGPGLRRPRPKTERPEKSGPRRLDFGDSEIVYDEVTAAEHDLPNGSFKPGDRVYHDAYGEGVIKRFEESGEKLKVVVRFPQGTKKFLAKFAPLRPVD